MANWLCTREQVKNAGKIRGASYDAQIDRIIDAVAKRIERHTRRYFVPLTETRLYRWPRLKPGGLSYVLRLDQDLLSLTTFQTKAQDASPTTIASTDYFLEPVNQTPYDRVEIDLSSTAAFESGATPQRSISLLGSWGYSNATKTGGTVSSGLASDAAAVSMVCSDASLIGVGLTLLIQSEQIFVSERTFAALASILVDDAGITADMADVTITVDTGHGIVKGEVIRLDSEEMLVEGTSATTLTVQRAYNGTVLATHANDTAVHINRTLTIVRGVNGTTAAVHANATAISIYDLPADIVNLAVAESLSIFHQEGSGWGRSVGMGEGAVELNQRQLAQLWKEITGSYQRFLMEAV